MNDRQLMLDRIRAAAADVPAGEPSAWDPRADDDRSAAYIRQRRPPAGGWVPEFVERCRDYRASVTLCGSGEGAIRDAAAEICSRQQVSRLAAPADLPGSWVPPGVELHGDEPALSVAELDACDGVISGCAVAIAATGTIVLDAGPAQGRRILTLIPDLHICVVAAEQVLGGVPEAISAVRRAAATGAPLTFISGPSATSDIELRRVEGVHGPRRLEVLLAGD